VKSNYSYKPISIEPAVTIRIQSLRFSEFAHYFPSAIGLETDNQSKELLSQERAIFGSLRQCGRDMLIENQGLRMPAVGTRSHTQRRPASANLQCTKSRKGEHPAAAGSMDIWCLLTAQQMVRAGASAIDDEWQDESLGRSQAGKLVSLPLPRSGRSCPPASAVADLHILTVVARFPPQRARRKNLHEHAAIGKR
jgi:hypothetical protein